MKLVNKFLTYIIKVWCILIAHISSKLVLKAPSLLFLLIRLINHTWNHISSLGNTQINCSNVWCIYRGNQTTTNWNYMSHIHVGDLGFHDFPGYPWLFNIGFPGFPRFPRLLKDFHLNFHVFSKGLKYLSRNSCHFKDFHAFSTIPIETVNSLTHSGVSEPHLRHHVCIISYNFIELLSRENCLPEIFV